MSISDDSSMTVRQALDLARLIKSPLCREDSGPDPSVDFDSAFDKSGRLIGVGDSVDVGEPQPTDLHKFPFAGTIIDVARDGIVCVVDQDGDCFQVNACNVKLKD